MGQALRGAADSFGIVTSFYLATKPAPITVIQWSFQFADMYSSAAKATNAFLSIQNFARNAAVIDRKIGFGIFLDGRTFRIGGTYFGSLDTFNNKVCGLLVTVLGHEAHATNPTDQTRALARASGPQRIQRSAPELAR